MANLQEENQELSNQIIDLQETIKNQTEDIIENTEKINQLSKLNKKLSDSVIESKKNYETSKTVSEKLSSENNLLIQERNNIINNFEQEIQSLKSTSQQEIDEIITVLQNKEKL